MIEKQNSPKQPHAERDPPLSPKNIQRQLHRILASVEFQATDQQREFLRFVVSETLAGNAHEIKGFTVATRVFGRKMDFDQTIDPIVSIQANKLRRALERYYLVAGKQDQVRIDLPKGTYVPTFQVQPPGEPDTVGPRVEDQDQERTAGWPSVLIQTFKNLTGDAEQDFLVEGLSTELAIELARYQDIVVLIRRREVNDKIHWKPVPRFQVKGSVRKDSKLIKVSVQLIDTRTRRQIWADSYHCDHDAAQLIAFQEHVSQVISAKIAGEHGVIVQTLSIESWHKPPANLETYEAILRYYQFDLIYSPENYFRALEALKHATIIEPGCGQVWPLLARLYWTNYTLEFFNVEETPLEEAVDFAERGVRLDPANQRARTALAFVRFFNNEIPAALAELERALALNPQSLFFMDNIGYLFTLLGEWQRGPALISKAIKLNPYYRHFVHYGLWLDWFRQEEYEQAYLETLSLRRQGIFWEPLCQAATFGMLGRLEEGKHAAEELLKIKPDFPTRGRVLIKHYIKFEDIVDRVIYGLGQASLHIT
jgi:adenylate cyclase